MGLHQLQRKSLLSIFFFTVCSLAFSQYALPTTFVPAHEPDSRPAPGVSPTPSPSPEWKPKKPGPLRRVFLHFLKCKLHQLAKEAELYQTGPQFPRSYNTNDFSFAALVQGGWRGVVLYKLPTNSSLIIAIEVMNVETFFQKLEGTGSQQEMMFTIPARFGKKPQAALISIKAIPDDPREKQPVDFQLYAMGMGDEAVGSVPIDIEVKAPRRINTARGETLAFDFRSSKFFNAVKCTFWLHKVSQKHNSYDVGSQPLGVLPADEKWKTGYWNGQNKQRRFSIGRHYLTLHSRTNNGPWIFRRTSDLFSVD
jgi:hypothetical protein